MGRGDDPDIDANRVLSTDPLDERILQDPQQPDLRRRGSSPISSRKSVPPSARSNHPWRVESAPVKLPRSCPKSWLSINSEGIAPQLTRMKGPPAREDREWIARETTSFPVPVSPRINTGTSEPATKSIRSMIRRRPDSAPTMMSSGGSVLPNRFSKCRFSESAASLSVLNSCIRKWFSIATEKGSSRARKSSMSRSERARLIGKVNTNAPSVPPATDNGPAIASPSKPSGTKIDISPLRRLAGDRNSSPVDAQASSRSHFARLDSLSVSAGRKASSNCPIANVLTT